MAPLAQTPNCFPSLEQVIAPLELEQEVLPEAAGLEGAAAEPLGAAALPLGTAEAIPEPAGAEGAALALPPTALEPAGADGAALAEGALLPLAAPPEGAIDIETKPDEPTAALLPEGAALALPPAALDGAAELVAGDDPDGAPEPEAWPEGAAAAPFGAW